MKKTITLSFSIILLITSCLTTNKQVNSDVVQILTPEPVAGDVIQKLKQILPQLDFQYTNRIDDTRHSNYLIIAIKDMDNSQVMKNSHFLFGPGPGPDHGFGGSYNGILYFTYLEISSIDRFSEEFERLLNRGNFFPPELMELFRENRPLTKNQSGEAFEEKEDRQENSSKPITVSTEESNQPEETAPALEMIPKEIKEEKKLSWNDMYPLGDLVESDKIIRFELNADIWSGRAYEIPGLGPLVQFDKAGPELFIFVNHSIFGGRGHLRGLQFLWEKDDSESKLITLDLTGSKVVAINAKLGEETGFETLKIAHWKGYAVYQLFCDYNPREYRLTYIEYEYDGKIYLAGKYSGDLDVWVADQVTKKRDRWFSSKRNLNGYFLYCLMTDGSIARYGYENRGFDTEVKIKGDIMLLNNHVGVFITGKNKGDPSDDLRIVRILDAVKYDPKKTMEMLDRQVIDNYMNR